MESDLSFFDSFVQIIVCRIDKTVDSEQFSMQALNRYLKTLKIIISLKQQINNGINFTGVYDDGDFLKKKRNRRKNKTIGNSEVLGNRNKKTDYRSGPRALF